MQGAAIVVVKPDLGHLATQPHQGGSFLFQKASTSHFPPVPLAPQGHPPLVKILAQLFGKLLGRDLDPMTNVMVTVGAYQALFCCFQAFIDEGDEVTPGLRLSNKQPFPGRALSRSAGSCSLFC